MHRRARVEVHMSSVQVCVHVHVHVRVHVCVHACVHTCAHAHTSHACICAYVCGGGGGILFPFPGSLFHLKDIIEKCTVQDHQCSVCACAWQ